MNKVLSPFTSARQDVPLASGEILKGPLPGANPVNLEEFIHDLRQPLGVIDSVAYYLELTATDEKMYPHLQRIRAMIVQASRILEKASLGQLELASWKVARDLS